MTVILFIPSACRALFQPEKETALPSKLVLRGLLAQEAQEHPGHGEPVSCEDRQTSAGLWGPPFLGVGEGAFRISFGGTRRVTSCRGPQHMLCLRRCQMVGIWLGSLCLCEPADPFSGSKMQKRIYNGFLKCLELGSCEELGREGPRPCLW